MTIEREIEDARSTRDAGVSSKRKESQSSSSSERSRGLLVHVGSRAAAIRARDRSGLPETGISMFQDNEVPVSGGTGEVTVYSSTP